MRVGLTCEVVGMWSRVCVVIDAKEVVLLDVVCCIVSMSTNDLGAEGGAAMAGAVQHLTSLTTLEYV
jgi:hypothetical protein